IPTLLKRSSEEFPNSKGLERAERLIEICRQLGATEYINAIGGQELYSKEFFTSKGITLHFIKPENIVYQQFDNEFFPWLSIIDVMMFNSVDAINGFLKKCTIS